MECRIDGGEQGELLVRHAEANRRFGFFREYLKDPDATAEAYVRPLVERAAFALSVNEAWLLLAAVALIALLLVRFAGKPPTAADAGDD